jgi:hypothetical protein
MVMITALQCQENRKGLVNDVVRVSVVRTCCTDAQFSRDLPSPNQTLFTTNGDAPAKK